MVFLTQAFYGQGINFEIFVKVLKVSKDKNFDKTTKILHL